MFLITTRYPEGEGLSRPYEIGLTPDPQQARDLAQGEAQSILGAYPEGGAHIEQDPQAQVWAIYRRRLFTASADALVAQVAIQEL